jgi:hypothetical protein
VSGSSRITNDRSCLAELMQAALGTTPDEVETCLWCKKASVPLAQRAFAPRAALTNATPSIPSIGRPTRR